MEISKKWVMLHVCQALPRVHPIGFRRWDGFGRWIGGAWVGPGGYRSWWKNGGKLPDLRPQEVEARDEMPKASPSGFGNEAPPEPYAHFEAIRQAQKDRRTWGFLWRLGDMQVMRLGEI